MPSPFPLDAQRPLETDAYQVPQYIFQRHIALAKQAKLPGVTMSSPILEMHIFNIRCKQGISLTIILPSGIGVPDIPDDFESRRIQISQNRHDIYSAVTIIIGFKNNLYPHRLGIHSRSLKAVGYPTDHL